jgi:hypothetical protein
MGLSIGDFLDPLGFFGGGGGGGGSSVTYGVDSTIQGGDKPISLVSTVQGGEKPIDVGLGDVNIDVGLDNVKIQVGGTEKPLHTITDINVPEEVKTKTDINSAIFSKLDVEPVQVDLCLNVGLSKLPKAHIRQPYESHFGVSVLGTELVGFDWSGESNVVIDELSSRPHVEPGREAHTNQSAASALPRRSQGRRRREIGQSEDGGLRIRLG